MPHVSVGLPVYNGEEFLREAIESVLAQSFTDFELILSDNASTDGTEAICREYTAADARVKYVRHPKNIGAAGNHNYVFSVTSGEFFHWMAHDDVLGPDFLSTCLQAIEGASAEPSIVYPNFVFIDDEGNVVERPPRGVTTGADRPAERFAEVLGKVGSMVEIYGLGRRSTIARSRLVGAFVSSDFVMIAEYALLGPIVRIDCEPQFYRRLHEGSSRRANETEEEVLQWFDPNQSAPPKKTHKRRSYNYFMKNGSIEFVKAIMLVEDLEMKDRMAALRVLLSRRLRSTLRKRLKR